MTARKAGSTLLTCTNTASPIWDSSCNVDVDLIVLDQINATKHETDEDKQFSRSSVKRQDRAYLNVLNPCDADGNPLPDCVGGPPVLRKRLWEDHQQCLGSALDVVWKADGIAVQGVGERKKIRNGRRFVPTGGRGGARPKEAVARTPPWLHPYATDAKKRKIERSVQRARAV